MYLIPMPAFTMMRMYMQMGNDSPPDSADTNSSFSELRCLKSLSGFFFNNRMKRDRSSDRKTITFGKVISCKDHIEDAGSLYVRNLSEMPLTGSNSQVDSSTGFHSSDCKVPNYFNVKYFDLF